MIFSYSGAADVGELADQTARKLTRNGDGKMFCLAGIGSRVSGILKSTEAAASILAIAGCALDYTKKSLENAGVTSINSDSIALIVDKAKLFLSEEALT